MHVPEYFTKVLLIKMCKIQLPDVLFLVFFIRFYIISFYKYHYLQIF